MSLFAAAALKGSNSKAGYSRLRATANNFYLAHPSPNFQSGGGGGGSSMGSCCCPLVPARKAKCLVILLCLVILTILGYGVYYHCPDGTACKPYYASGGNTSSKHFYLGKHPTTNNSSKGASSSNSNNNGGKFKPKYNLDDDLAKQLIDMNQNRQQFAVNFIDYVTIKRKQIVFDLEGSDVMVFLHIQKTGGTTFERHLVHDIDLETPCQSRGYKGRRKKGRKKGRKKDKNNPNNQVFQCFRPGSTNSWLFSRYNTGWKCGLHADWTELTECVDSYLDATEGVTNRQYFYMTFLREPVTRYVSEYLHVKRGATWKDSQYMCDGKPGNVAPCYEEDADGHGDWSGVTLEEFSGCGSNMAFNRQTRMLADLRLINCYNSTGMDKWEREERMLKSAKANLEKMAFFGITAQQARSQFLFEDTFGLKFKINFEEQSEDQKSQQYLSLFTPKQMQTISNLNRLDIELYDFAKQLMDKRYRDATAAVAAASVVANANIDNEQATTEDRR